MEEYSTYNITFYEKKMIARERKYKWSDNLFRIENLSFWFSKYKRWLDLEIQEPLVCFL